VLQQLEAIHREVGNEGLVQFETPASLSLLNTVEDAELPIHAARLGEQLAGSRLTPTQTLCSAHMLATQCVAWAVTVQASSGVRPALLHVWQLGVFNGVEQTQASGCFELHETFVTNFAMDCFLAAAARRHCTPLEWRILPRSRPNVKSAVSSAVGTRLAILCLSGLDNR